MQVEKATLTVRELSEMLGIGLTTTYDLIKKKQFHTIKVGRKILIPKVTVKKWLEGDETNG